jgi:hypothetical protein
MSTVSIKAYINGILADPDSVVLADETNTYGIKRNDTGATIIPSGTTMVRISTGIYEYSFPDPANDLIYTYTTKITVCGQDYYETNILEGPKTSEPKYRYQSIVFGNTVYLDLYNYNNNQPMNLFDIQQVEVYFLDPTSVSPHNPDGRIIKTIVSPSGIENVEEGHYRVQVQLDPDLYEIGSYVDLWKIKHNSYEDQYSLRENQFKVQPELVATTDRPFAYDVAFSFSPKKMTKGSKQYLKIGFKPVVHIDIGNENIINKMMDQFYYNLKASGGLYVKIELMEGCGYNSEFPLANIKTDPEWDLVEVRGDNEAYYMLDSSEDQDDYDLGIYQVQFKCLVQGQTILSRKFYLQIFD